MPFKIGVYGSNIVESEHALNLARQLGQALAERGCIVITGGCSGMPYAVASTAAQHGAEVWGFTPALDLQEHRRAYPQDDVSIYRRLIYVPASYHELFGQVPASAELDWAARLKYRNVISTVNSDAGIIITGGWGTLNEFTNLIYDGKPIGVLIGSGGLADELPAWYPRLRKKTASPVLFEADPTRLLTLVLEQLEQGAQEA
jgi:predicted Rossmann-fold nucleotide-binding protein